MRAPVATSIYKLSVAAMTLLLACALAQPVMADELQVYLAPSRASTDVNAGDAPMLASLMASGAGHISAAVALEDDPEPVVGSFTLDGLTYAIVGKGEVALVSVDSDAVALAADSSVAGEEGRGVGSGVPPRSEAEQVPSGAASPSPSPEGASSDGVEDEGAFDPVILEVPESVEYGGTTYSVVAIGPRAFAGCDADAVTIPAAVESVDELAFRGSAVASIEVADGNPSHSSFDGMLFDADMTSLLLIPEGKQGAVRIPKAAEVVPADAFSHCASVTAIEADAGSAAFSSRNGCLYDAAGETLLRVPAGATEIEMADGCTTVAAGALEGCVKLRSIQAPASVVEVSPDVLGAASDGLPEIDPASIVVRIPEGADPAPWEVVGFEFEVASGATADDAEPAEDESPDGLAPEDVHNRDDDETDGASPDDPVIVDEVTIGYSYANERSSADGAYERAIPKVDAVLKLQPLGAEDLAKGPASVESGGTDTGSRSAASDGASSSDGNDAEADAASSDSDPVANPPLASKLADLPEDSQATASFLYEGCLYVIDPEGGAALVAVDPKRLAERVEDPTTLILPDYVDDGTWSYPLTRIAKGALAGSGIERLWIPASATYLDYALEDCETLRYVEISEDSPVYSSKRGCLYDKAGETLWMAPEGHPIALDHDASRVEAALVSHQQQTKLDAKAHRVVSSALYFPKDHALSTRHVANPYHAVSDFHSLDNWTRENMTTERLVVDKETQAQLYQTNSAGQFSQELTLYLSWPCSGKCTIERVSPSPEGPRLDGVIGPYTSATIYVVGFNRAPAEDYRSVEFVFGPAFSPATTTLMLSTCRGIRMGVYENEDAKITQWIASSTDHVFTPNNYVWDDDAKESRFIASFERKRYSVNIDLNYPDAPDDIQLKALATSGVMTPSLIGNAPSRPGYLLWGIYDDPAFGNGNRYFSGTGSCTKYWTNKFDGKLYCHWTPNTYKVEYNVNDPTQELIKGRTYNTGDAFDLPTPTRYGYQFDGWDVEGAQGAGVETVAGADGAKVTRVKAGTYGDLSCTARWTLRYDLDVPVCDPGSVTFEADSLTGQVRVKPGTSAEGAILSYMAVPGALDSLSCEGLDAAGSPDPAGGAPELEAVFGAGSASKVRFTATFGEGASALTAKVTAGGSSATASLAGLSVPAATSPDAPGRIKVAYGLELDPDLAIPPVRDAAPVARLAYTVSLAGAGA